ncbi:MAG: hypothetical protein K6E21_02850 [Bacilli bacterium]|nr:hypothetical protein [Bacilli bacterium]
MFIKKFGCTPKAYRKEHMSADGPSSTKTYTTEEKESIYSASESIKALEAYKSAKDTEQE